MMNEWGFGYATFMGPIGMIIFTILLVLPFWRICSKAGYSGALSLFIFIPLANLIFLYWLAFADWPSSRRNPDEHN